jgi:hypothetical protein
MENFAVEPNLTYKGLVSFEEHCMLFIFTGTAPRIAIFCTNSKLFQLRKQAHTARKSDIAVREHEKPEVRGPQ